VRDDARMAYPQYQPQSYRDPTAVMGRRILAYIIDALITVILFAIAFIALAHRQAVPPFLDNACDAIRADSNVRQCFQSGDHVYYLRAGEAAFVYLLAIGAGFLNNVVMQGVSGASVGKFITGLRVVDNNGQICGIVRAVVRWLLLIVDAFFCFLIGLITALVSKGHRRIGDMVANTYVVGARDVGVPPTPLVTAPYVPGAYGMPSGTTGGWQPPTTPAPPPTGWTPPPAPGAPPPTSPPPPSGF
jgi:uncharacterized RDD family membrane protein YckC